MLFTYKNSPVLKAVKEKTLNGIEVADNIQNAELIEDLWVKYSPIFSNRIQRISDTFWTAMLQAEEKLNSDKVLNQTPVASGVFIFREFCYCYHIDKDNTVVIFYFCLNVLCGCVYRNVKTGETHEQLFSTPPNNQQAISQLINDNFLYINFLKYAPIEVKLIGANKKTKDVHGKYMNQTDYDIEVIDSTWFTTLVRSEGFKVRGHFRLQPHGAGLTETKLIWIDEFQKDGYVRNFKRPIDIDE